MAIERRGARGARHGLRGLALATALAVALSGCGSIRERKEQADRIIDSVDRAVAAGSAQMSVTVKADLKLEGAQRLAAGGGAGDAEIPAMNFAAQADLARDRVAYLDLGDGTSPEAIRIYAGTTLFLRRLDAETDTQRPWVRLDLTSVDPDEIDNGDIETADALRRVQETQGFDNPLFLLKLLRGTLSGSVKKVGEEDVRGARTTRYKFNIDREKAVRDEDEDVQDAYEALFKSMFATRTVFPGEVWLDDKGLPRRYSVVLKSSVRRRALVDFRLTVEMFEVGQPVRIVLPGKRETSRVEGLGGLAQAITGGAG